MAEGDHAAFAALVARHGPMVLGVCRRVLRDERDVEDAFQATFLVLVRRAGAIRDGDRVGRWLHGVAHRVAVRRGRTPRRFVHEQSVADPTESAAAVPASEDAERRELTSIVDQEVMRLPSALQAPVVLCYLEGMSHDEAAKRLRWPVGTVRSRMARARDVLRHRLARRGVTADGTAIVAALARSPVPPDWLVATVRGSLNLAKPAAAAAAEVLSDRPAAIARRVLQTMTISKLSYLGAAGLGLVVALGGVRTLAIQGPGEAKPPGSTVTIAGQSDRRAGPPRSSASTEPASDERMREIASSLVGIDDELDRMRQQFNTLQTRLRKLQTEIDPVRRGRPTRPPAPTPAIPPTAATRPADPTYVNFGGEMIMVISPDGSKVGLFNVRTGRPQPVSLPAFQGSRREFIVMPDDINEKPYPLLRKRPSGTAIENSHFCWFIALDLDRRGNVTRIAGFDPRDGTWIDQPVPDPVDRSAVAMYPGCLLVLGRRIYALSKPAKRWGVLDLPSEAASKAVYQRDGYWADVEGRLFRFNAETGHWDDIYARALDPTAVDTSRTGESAR